MDYYLGEIQLFPYNYEPYGFVECKGQSLNIQQNAALYSVIGITYGGDGQQTFKLPNLTNSSPIVGMKYYIATMGNYPMRP